MPITAVKNVMDGATILARYGITTGFVRGSSACLCSCRNLTSFNDSKDVCKCFSNRVPSLLKAVGLTANLVWGLPECQSGQAAAGSAGMQVRSNRKHGAERK